MLRAKNRTWRNTNKIRLHYTYLYDTFTSTAYIIVAYRRHDYCRPITNETVIVGTFEKK